MDSENGKVQWLNLIVINSKVTIRMIRKMEKEFTLGQVEIFTKVTT